MNIVVLGLSHHLSPVELRERFAFAEAKIPDALKSLRESGVATEAVILSTCNRVEIYAATPLTPDAAVIELKRFLQQWGETPGEQAGSSRRDDRTARRAVPTNIGDELYSLAEPQSLHHLFKVACGLDSMVLGETEILGQLKQAYALAHRHGHTGARLNKAFQRAFNVAKHIRTETNIQRGSVSVASVAVELAEKIFSSLNGREVMVIGAGDTSEKTARALLSRGARSIIVANRSPDRAVALAKELGGRAVQFGDWAAEFQKIDIVISSTAAPHHILDRARLEPLMKLRHHRPLLLIDIAVPRDIDPEVNFLENVYLYNIDDLQAIADDYLRLRKVEIERCEAIIAEKVKALLTAKDVQPRMGTDEHGQKMKTIYPKPSPTFGKLVSFLVSILFLTIMSLKALATDLTNEWAKANWAYKQSDFQIALSHYNEILKIDSNNVAALIGKAGAYRGLKQFDAAENACNEAIRLSSNNLSLSLAFLYRGYVHTQTTNLNQAIDDFSKAIQYNPALADAYIHRANAFLLSGAYDPAIQDCNMAIMLLPGA
jgi:glutamyl-tRNA reductase